MIWLWRVLLLLWAEDTTSESVGGYAPGPPVKNTAGKLVLAAFDLAERRYSVRARAPFARLWHAVWEWTALPTIAHCCLRQLFVISVVFEASNVAWIFRLSLRPFIRFFYLVLNAFVNQVIVYCYCVERCRAKFCFGWHQILQTFTRLSKVTPLNPRWYLEAAQSLCWIQNIDP